MTIEAAPPPATSKTPLWSLPNQLTVARLGASVVLFVCLTYGWFATAFVLFVVGASTDWLDGYFARKYGLVTQLGRILDPFADKLIICGTFIFLGALYPASRIPAWIAVVVMARELLVTALRSFLEQRGRDFSAEMAGKLKMVFQCIAAGASLFYLAFGQPGWLALPLDVCLWTAVALTVYSGATYVRRAIRLASE
jgi:CDP-diacylglycerol--glycerol-3-phosphate 3-phosphatidyltransferase